LTCSKDIGVYPLVSTELLKEKGRRTSIDKDELDTAD
jgi:hypothetical protein